MSDKYDEITERIIDEVRKTGGWESQAAAQAAAILREAFPDHIVDADKMVKPVTCDSCGDPLDVDGDRSYHICAVCAESGCFPGTTRNPFPLIEVDAPGEAPHLPWREALDIANAEIATLRAQLAEERAKLEESVEVGRYFCAAMPCSPTDCTGTPCDYLKDAIANRNNRPTPDATAAEDATALEGIAVTLRGYGNHQFWDELRAIADRLRRPAPDATALRESEPLAHLSRAELQLNIMRNLEREVSALPRRNAFRFWWENSINWVKVQAIINANTTKAGSTSSGEQCRFIGADPNAYSFREARALLRSEPRGTCNTCADRGPQRNCDICHDGSHHKAEPREGERE